MPTSVPPLSNTRKSGVDSPLTGPPDPRTVTSMTDTLMLIGVGLLLLVTFLSWLFEFPRGAYPNDDYYVTDDE